jgi:DNA-binding transcriptional LysR family regulator
MSSSIVHLDEVRSRTAAKGEASGARSAHSYAQAITVEQLRVLVAVAERGSFSAAARALRKTQSNVSYHVACLEDQLGVTLFDRTGRRPCLTPQGETVVAHAEEVLAGLDHLRAATFSLTGCLEARVSLAMDDRFPPCRLSKVLSRFRARFPSVALCIERAVEPTASTAQALEDVHLGVVAHARPDDGLITAPSMTIDLLPVVAACHPLAGGVAGDDDLARHAEVTLLGPAADDAPHGAPWRVASEPLRLDLLRGGLGWARMPRHLVEDDLARGTLVPLTTKRWGDRPIQIDLHVARRRDRPIGPGVKWLFDALTQRP